MQISLGYCKNKNTSRRWAWLYKFRPTEYNFKWGEAQRVKLATELSKRDTGKTLYILDEPTTGLHFEDVKVLMEVIDKLVNKGNTVLIIEHNMDVIKLADYLIDIGPEGGAKGGRIVAQGIPEDVAKSTVSYTAHYLKQELSLD